MSRTEAPEKPRWMNRRRAAASIFSWFFSICGSRSFGIKNERLFFIERDHFNPELPDCQEEAFGYRLSRETKSRCDTQRLFLLDSSIRDHPEARSPPSAGGRAPCRRRSRA